MNPTPKSCHLQEPEEEALAVLVYSLLLIAFSHFSLKFHQNSMSHLKADFYQFVLKIVVLAPSSSIPPFPRQLLSLAFTCVRMYVYVCVSVLVSKLNVCIAAFWFFSVLGIHSTMECLLSFISMADPFIPLFNIICDVENRSVFSVWNIMCDMIRNTCWSLPAVSDTGF